jgi:hypothetical protein
MMIELNLGLEGFRYLKMQPRSGSGTFISMKSDCTADKQQDPGLSLPRLDPEKAKFRVFCPEMFG